MCFCPGIWCAQARLLTWKNWKLKTRSWGSTCVEVFLPCLAFVILLAMRAAVPVDNISQQLNTNYAVSTVTQIPQTLIPFICGSIFPTEFSSGNVQRFPQQKLVVAPLVAGDTAVNAVLPGLVSHIRRSLGYAASFGYPEVCGVNVQHFINSSDADGMVQQWESNEQLNEYIASDGYDLHADIPIVNMAVIVNSVDFTAKQIDYSIRGNASTMAFGDAVDNFRVKFDQTVFMTYEWNFILPLKLVVDQWVMKEMAGVDMAPSDTTLVPFPLADHKYDRFADSLSQIFGLFLVLAFLWPFSRLVRHMVEEKELRIKEGMKIMGLRNSVFWCTWGSTYMILFFIVTVLAIFFARVAIFQHSDSGVIFMFFFLFSLSLISLGFMVSALFTQAKTAGTLSPFVLLVFFLPFFFVSSDNQTFAARSGASLLSPVAFGLGGVKILQYEAAFIGSQWNNVSEMTEGYSVGTALGYMFLDFFLYGFIAWYLDTIAPSEYGTHEAPWFLCTASWWGRCCSAGGTETAPIQNPNGYDPINATPHVQRVPLLPTGDGKTTDSEIDGSMISQPQEQAIPDEPVPEALAQRAGVKIRALRKTFGSDENKFVAVHSLDLDLYMGQIFVLLGHNGAGKTTTINMLTGMYPPTSGNAWVMGHDIAGQIDTVRTSLGICPQHDILFPTLSVREHLEFFGSLKNLKGPELAAAVQHAIEEVQLTHATEQPAGSLSGGQKRRLSLAIALIGGSKVVFLDEPTSGVDPASRRAIWELLTRKKAEGRVIVLTTHFMDEADQLGDRIAILHHGKKKVCGSSLYLKRKFGVGYTFTLTKTHKDAKSSDITHVVQTHVPDGEKLSDVGTEISFRLPLGSSAKFSGLLNQLDEQKEALGVAHYGLSVTTLEEVFIKVATSKDEEENKKAIRKLTSRRFESLEREKKMAEAPAAAAASGGRHAAPSIVDGQGAMDDVSDEYLSANSDNQSFCRHFQALFMKRFHVAKRDKKGICCTLLLPVLIVLGGLSLGMIPASLFTKPVNLTTDQYNTPLPVPLNDFLDPFWYAQSPSEPLLAFAPEQLAFTPYAANTNISTFDEMEMAVLAVRTSRKESAFGAFFQPAPCRVNCTAANGYPPPMLQAYNISVFVNMTGTHAAPTFQHIAHNALLRNLTRNPNAYIRTNLWPFDLTRTEVAQLNRFNGLTTAIVVAIGYCFIPSAIAVFVVKERESKAKHIQIISGVSIEAYWLSSYLWDFIQCMIPSIIGALIVLGFGNSNFVGDNFGPVFLTMLFYALSVVPFTYLLSFLFTSHSTAQNVMIMLYLVSGLLMSIVSFVLFVIPSTRDTNTKIVRPLFRLFPSFCLGDALIALSFRELLQETEWDLSITGAGLIYMAVESVVYFALTLAVERLANIPSFVAWFKSDPVVNDPPLPLDTDVVQEKQRIVNGQAANDIIRIEGLRKTFPPAKAAAKDVWYAVPPGECFGFLGQNGAGKTTTISMLTGEIPPTSGAAYLGGFNVATEPRRVQQLMGYCPQFDALHELLTAKETIEFYARIRGVPESKVDGMVDFLITRLSLTDYKNKPAGTYSGGNKRKLSVAIALIGNPKVVFLDEPSTGMDPVSRRFMWTFISETMAKRAVILTTHSMEECEALCHRIGIFAAGQLQCIGTSQHLKHKFGRGFQLDISTGGRAVDKARAWVQQQFPGCVELECYASFMKFRIPPLQNMTLGQIFAAVEANKNAVDIAEYSIGQTTLEQIFLQIATGAQNAATAAGPQPFLPPGFVPAPQFAGAPYQQQQQQQQQQFAVPMPPSGYQAAPAGSGYVPPPVSAGASTTGYGKIDG